MAAQFSDTTSFDPFHLPQRARAMSQPEALALTELKVEKQAEKIIPPKSHHRRSASFSIADADREVAQITMRANQFSYLEATLNTQFINALALLIILREKTTKIFADMPKDSYSAREKSNFLNELHFAIEFDPKNFDFKENCSETRKYLLELFESAKICSSLACKILRSLNQKNPISKADLPLFHLAFKNFTQSKILRYQIRVLLSGLSRDIRAKTELKKPKPLTRTFSVI